jgi:hypothetical protein
MKITTDGLPKSESEETSFPETVSGRLKLGIGVPSSRMLEGVRAMWSVYRDRTAAATRPGLARQPALGL